MIYHYTSLDVLHKIIAGVKPDKGEVGNSIGEVYLTLHATSAYFLNDWTESQLVPNILLELGVAPQILEVAVNVLGQPFVLSFSSNSDSLPMWKSYANGGQGVALEFNEDILKEKMYKQKVEHIGDCRYVDEEGLKDIIEKDALFQEYLLEKTNATPILKLLIKSLGYKHIGFEYEKEYRILVCKNDGWNYRNTDNAIIPYIEVPIPIEALTLIRIGTCLDYERTQYSINQLLKTYFTGFNDYPAKPIVRKSLIPFLNR